MSATGIEGEVFRFTYAIVKLLRKKEDRIIRKLKETLYSEKEISMHELTQMLRGSFSYEDFELILEQPTKHIKLKPNALILVKSYYYHLDRITTMLYETPINDLINKGIRTSYRFDIDKKDKYRRYFNECEFIFSIEHKDSDVFLFKISTNFIYGAIDYKCFFEIAFQYPNTIEKHYLCGDLIDKALEFIDNVFEQTDRKFNVQMVDKLFNENIHYFHSLK